MTYYKPTIFEDYRSGQRIVAIADVVDDNGQVLMHRRTLGVVRTSIKHGHDTLLYVATDDGREVRFSLPALIRLVKRRKVTCRQLLAG